jgi:predicted P-loop ATPase
MNDTAAPPDTLTMEGENIRTIYDKFGVLIQRKNSRGAWVSAKRKINDYEIDLERRWSEDYINALEATGANIQQNEMNDILFVNGEQLNDARQSVIVNRLRDIGLVGEVKMQDALNEMGYTNRFHPIKRYLESLAAWDGTDHIGKFLDHFTFGSNPDISRSFFRRWLIGSVAKIYQEVQTFMLVLDGRQGIGKSYVPFWLCSGLPGMFIESSIRPDDKDSFVRAVSYWIWEVGELQATTRRADVEALKDFISKRVVTVRLPYAKRDISRPATASLIGTVNENGGGFLADMTGNRRFAVVNVQSIDWAYSQTNVNDLWSHVLACYRAGESNKLTIEESAVQSQVNEAYEVMSPAVEYLFARYEVSPSIVGSVPFKEILAQLQLDGLTSAAHYTLQIAGALQKKGAVKVKTMHGAVYHHVRRHDGL